MIELDGLEMDYGAVKALKGVSLSVVPGEVLGLIGENGAGKSTLLKILSGTQLPTGGTLRQHGQPVRFANVRQAEAAGIVMIHQELNLIPTLSVADNIVLGREPGPGFRIDRAATRAQATAALAEVGSKANPDTLVQELSIADQQLVEIAKAISKGSSLVIMDEPTAVLAQTEVASLLELVRKLREAGKAVIYVSHRLDEVKAVCDRTAILRDGELVGLFDVETLSIRDMAEKMVGRTLENLYPPKSESAGGEVAFKGFGLTLRKGEIVGLGGLIGSGRTELAEQIRRAPGTTRVAYVSEDRKGTGLHLTLTARENVTLANLTHPILNKSAETARTQHWIDQLQIKISSPETVVGTLSGGNQQKVAVAKFLETAPEVLILDEPTRGVDVGAKLEIYRLIVEMAKDGLAILVISSELGELIGLCHRIVIMREGHLAGEVSDEHMTEQNLMRLAAGVAA